MSYNLVKYFGGPIEAVQGAERLALRLFLQIEHHHGEAEARRIFENACRELTQSEKNERKGWHIIERYDRMEDKNKAELARQIFAENAELPDSEQLTPRPRPTLPTIYSYIGELLRERKAAIKAGTWKGPEPHDFFSWG